MAAVVGMGKTGLHGLLQRSARQMGTGVDGRAAGEVIRTADVARNHADVAITPQTGMGTAWRLCTLVRRIIDLFIRNM